MEFLTLLLFLIVTSKSIVYAQSTTNCFKDNSPCTKLNEILSPCNGAFGPPPEDASTVSTYLYTVDNANLASCLCNQNAYDTLSSCVSCYSNENNKNNMKVAEFTDYQKSCKGFGHAFGKPLKEEKSDSVNLIKMVLIGVFVLLLLIIGSLSFWYWRRRRSKRISKEKEKKEKEKENKDPPVPGIERTVSRNSSQETPVNQLFTGTERSISRNSRNSRNSLQETFVHQPFSGNDKRNSFQEMLFNQPYSGIERPNSRSSLQETSSHQPFSGNERTISRNSLQETSAHQPSSGTERPTSRNSLPSNHSSSSTEGLLYNEFNRSYRPPSPSSSSSYTGLFPPPGTIQQQYSTTSSFPFYTPPRYSAPITTPLQMYLPQQPQPSQPPPPPQPSYPSFQSSSSSAQSHSAQIPPRPPVRNSYQHLHYNRGRAVPSPPHNYYNANNYYGGY